MVDGLQGRAWRIKLKMLRRVRGRNRGAMFDPPTERGHLRKTVCVACREWELCVLRAVAGYRLANKGRADDVRRSFGCR